MVPVGRTGAEAFAPSFRGSGVSRRAGNGAGGAARRAALAALLLWCAACTRGAPEGFVTVELVHRITGRQERETIHYGAEGVRYERPDGTWILRYANRTVFSRNADGTFSETSLDEVLAREREKNLRPDVPDLAGGVGGAGATIERSADRSVVAGVPATLTRIRHERFDVEVWTTDALAPPGPRRPTFELLEALGGPLALPAVLFDHLDGFPVRSIVRARGGPWEMKVARSLVSLERRSPTAEELSPSPAGGAE